MDDDDYSTLFCSEVVKYAYDAASHGSFILPKFRSRMTKFKDSEYPKNMGVTKTSLFAPYDMEVDPRFELVAEYRHNPLLRQVRMQDSVLQSIYDWMIEKDYKFHGTVGNFLTSNLGKVARQLGFGSTIMPKYMPVDSIKVTLQFNGVASVLEQNIYKQEAAYLKRHGYLPTFQDMMAMNDRYRQQDCLLHEQWKERQKSGYAKIRSQRDQSQFHIFFRNDVESCE